MVKQGNSMRQAIQYILQPAQIWIVLFLKDTYNFTLHLRKLILKFTKYGISVAREP